MSDEDYKNFVRRRFKPAARRAGWLCTPYDLRHFNASLLIKEGRLSLQEVAMHLGHTLVELSRTYAHEIAEYRGRQVDVQQEMSRVRRDLHDTEPLRAIALELGVEPSSEVCAASSAARTSAPMSRTGALQRLVELNSMGVLTDDELVTKVKSLVTRQM